MSPRQEQEQKQPTPGDMMGMVYFLCNAHATALTPFLRSGFGKEALGVPGLSALVTILVYAAWNRSPGMISCFLPVWLLAVLWRRLETFRLLRRGAILHTRWAGNPWLARLFCRQDKTAFNAEPAMCWMVGMMFLPLSQPFGVFLMAGFLSLGIRRAIEEQINTRRLDSLMDNEIEAQWYADLHREKMRRRR